ncbi:group 3 secretory phospholipase A2-like isoform X1 [Labrus mixtus]|uniref:group 3 secretory phospholipase A2-like isoform X1 n=1 Tax=Labrus mixtus TaxID=508554 RepID=UPI0029C0CF04|nr:group 3 secretory phospholipase A2-like isoform X1 [Labrus mixtus]
MHSRCLPQVLLALSSLIFSKAQDFMGSGISCVRSSRADDGQTRVTFLREETAGARSLYLTLWSEDKRLVTCEVNPSPVVTERYLALCDECNTQRQEVSQRFNISALLVSDAPCAPRFSDNRKFFRRARQDGKEGKTRSRRSVIFPGTLWCGTGSRALGYEQLGMFEGADRCCREHDHCQHIIPAFTVNYGVFNSKFFTVSHCDCDQRFRQCLLGVNDTISSMVGYSFFNILQVPCFELKPHKRCTEMYWWGMCKVANVAPYAFFKSPVPFNTSDLTSQYGDNTDSTKITGTGGWQVTERPVISTKSPKSDHRCSSRDPPRGDTFHRRRKKGKGCKRHQKLSTVAPSQRPSVTTATPLMKMGVLNASNGSSLLSKKERVGKKKSTRKVKSSFTTQKSQVSLNVTTILYPHTTSATQSTASFTHKQNMQLQIPTAWTKTAESKKKVQKQTHCCGLPLRGVAFQRHCKRCPKLKASDRMTITSSTPTYRLPIKSLEKLQLKKTTEKDLKQDTFKKLRSRATSTKPKQAVSSHEEVKTQGMKSSHLVWNNTRPESLGRTKAPATAAERGLTENHLLCESLKHLDECQYKIPPLEKKYELQNMESKTAYHCDCTSRLALEIKSYKQPSVLPTLLMDFVSEFCFKPPKERKCHSKKSCSGGFTKASDLLRALKKIEGKATAVVRNAVNDRKRGIPVRLSKRCLRLQREAAIMAQLTRL